MANLESLNDVNSSIRYSFLTKEQFPFISLVGYLCDRTSLCISIFPFDFSVTINKTSDLDNNTDTLKKLSSSSSAAAAADKPNNQTKLASISGTPLPPSHMKCNILKGNSQSWIFQRSIFNSKTNEIQTCFFLVVARAEEEATTPTKLTNQLYVKSANNTNHLCNANSLSNGDDSLNAATFVSVVSGHSRAQSQPYQSILLWNPKMCAPFLYGNTLLVVHFIFSSLHFLILSFFVERKFMFLYFVFFLIFLFSKKKNHSSIPWNCELCYTVIYCVHILRYLFCSINHMYIHYHHCIHRLCQIWCMHALAHAHQTNPNTKMMTKMALLNVWHKCNRCCMKHKRVAIN